MAQAEQFTRFGHCGDETALAGLKYRVRSPSSSQGQPVRTIMIRCSSSSFTLLFSSPYSFSKSDRSDRSIIPLSRLVFNLSNALDMAYSPKSNIDAVLFQWCTVYRMVVIDFVKGCESEV